MSKLISLRIDERLLERIDRSCRRAGVSRSRAVHDAFELWLRKKRLDEAIRREHEGYERHPIREDEFGPVLRAQAWPE